MNRLQQESSPYLLQHAHNPVDWYAWKPEAFERAQKEDKPILVSIGYSTCHWCHVMERESFENEEVAAFMNEYFINIKVDREERPDVDQIYMDACQIISGQGGWPLNCFLLPDGRPFFAGTYYPPRPAHGRPSWIQLLQNLAYSFRERRQTAEDQARQLTEMIKNGDKVFIGSQLEIPEGTSPFPDTALDQVFKGLAAGFDKVEGGFGGAPKFPGTMPLEFLLAYHFYRNNEQSLEHLRLSLDKMIRGGIYDQLSGGFARYATDRAWLVPHFEKMLYDNALLVGLLAQVYACTREPLYREAIEETLAYIQTEMTHPEGGFYSALDADSEGVEGKFYVWSYEEAQEVLGPIGPLFCEYYDITPPGNWEGHNILRRKYPLDTFAAEKGWKPVELQAALNKGKQLLLQRRATRVRPHLDDKQILGWNALQVTAYAKAAMALESETYRQEAIRQLDFLLQTFAQPGSDAFFHTYKNGKTHYEAFLDDYAYLVEALLNVYELDFDHKRIEQANRLSSFVLDHFLDSESNLLYFTSVNQQDIILRKREMIDSATPSGNAVMAIQLHRLAILKGNERYRLQAEKMFLTLKASVEKYPSSFARWALGLAGMAGSPQEIAVIGRDAKQTAWKLSAFFRPFSVIMASESADDRYPLLAARKVPANETQIFICRNYACNLPVSTVEEALKNLTTDN